MKRRRKMLFVGFEEWSSKMYPHSHHVLRILRKHYDICYYAKEDRGRLATITSLAQISWRYPKRIVDALQQLLRLPKYPGGIPDTWKYFVLNLYQAFQKNRQIDRDLSILLKRERYDLILVLDQSAYWRITRLIRGKNRQSARLIVWSHDYYCPGHPLFSYFWIQKIIRHNRKTIKKCSLVIIQDQARSTALDSQIGADKIPRVYLPVSLFSDSQSKAIALKNEKKRYQKPKTLCLLHLGCIGKERHSDLFLKEYQNLPKHITLIYHGFIQNDMQPLLQSLDRKPSIRKAGASLAAMKQSLALADIGLISFRDLNLNTFFTSKASGQLTQFMQCGIPVICYNLEDMGIFLEMNGAGVYIKVMSDLHSAIKKIASRYSQYSKKAYQTYLKYFDLSRYEKTLIDSLQSLAK